MIKGAIVSEDEIIDRFVDAFKTLRDELGGIINVNTQRFILDLTDLVRRTGMEVVHSSIHLS